MSTRLTRHGNRLAAVALASVLALTACGAAPERDSEEDLASSFEHSVELADDYDPNGHFNYGLSTLTPGWDPIASVSGYDYTSLAPVYDRLVYNAPDGTLEPMLATGWISEDDDTSLVLELREGVTFSDGTPFNAEAVKINLDRAQGESSRISTEIAQLTAVEVVDEYTVKLRTETGAGALLGALSQRPGMMASPQAIAAGNLATTPVGAGAYTVTAFVSGDSVDYVKREGYWDPDAQRVATMTVKLITDDQTRLNALQSGELDGSIVRPVQAISADDSGMKVISRPSVIFLYLLINSAKEPFNDPLVREALNYAVDRVDIGEGLFEGLCDPQIQPWPSTSIAWSEEIGDGLDIWPHDPEKAKELLAEAGYPDGGITMPTVTTNVTFVMQLSEILQAQLAEVGITMTIEPVPTPQVVELFSVVKSVAANVNPYSGSSDPHGIASRHFLEGSVYDVGEPVDPSIIELATEASTPLDPAERTPIYHEMMQAMIDHPTHLLPLCAQHISVALDPEKVSGVSVYTAGFMDLRGVAVK